MDLVERGLPLVTGAGALGCGLVAGGLFAFSTFVMPALSRLPPHEGIAAMQAINVVVLRSPFIAVFLSTAAVSGTLCLFALRDVRQPNAVGLLIGGGFYLIGTVVVTGLGNMPLNNRLAAVAPGTPTGDALWARYLIEWTRWNHVRTGAALAAMAALIVAIRGAL